MVVQMLHLALHLMFICYSSKSLKTWCKGYILNKSLHFSMLNSGMCRTTVQNITNISSKSITWMIKIMFILLQSQLEDALSEKAAKEEQFKKEIEDLQSRLSQLDSDKETSERRLREDLAQLHRDLIGKVALHIL